MASDRRMLLTGVLAAFVSIGCLCLRGVADEQTDGSTQPQGEQIIAKLRVIEPLVHKNLAVYFLESDQRDDQDFLTLNEGLKQGLIKVTEKKNEQVSRLVIENLSDKPVFLQEGDRVTGGKQDRTIYSSLIIVAKSGPHDIPAFCVEASRWREGATGKKFVGNANLGYAANNVRQASKLFKNQRAVWDRVAQTKQDLMKAIGTTEKTSSLNEAQDSEKVVQSTKEFVEALGKAAQEHEGLVGVAFAINGVVQEVNVYPGRAITQKIYPRLLETYALDAIVQARLDKEAAKAEAPAKAQILALLRAPVEEKATRDEKIDNHNGLQIHAAIKADEQNKSRVYRCLTNFDGKPVHLQWIRGPEKTEAVQQDQQNRLPQSRNNANQVEQSDGGPLPQRQDEPNTRQRY